MRRNTIAFAVAAVLATAGAGMLYAQTPQQGMGMMEMMGMCPMMQAAAEGPAAMLRHQDTLDLSADQIARLESLRDEAAEARRADIARMMETHQEITRAGIGEEFDEGAVRDAFDRMGDLHADMGVRMLRMRHAALQVLSADQRRMFTDLRPAAGGMGAMHGMGGMMEMMKNCPMMQGMGATGDTMRNRPMLRGMSAPAQEGTR